MTRLQDLKDEYKDTFEDYKEAREEDNKKDMKRLSHDLVKIADQMEYER